MTEISAAIFHSADHLYECGRLIYGPMNLKSLCVFCCRWSFFRCWSLPESSKTFLCDLIDADKFSALDRWLWPFRNLFNSVWVLTRLQAASIAHLDLLSLHPCSTLFFSSIKYRVLLFSVVSEFAFVGKGSLLLYMACSPSHERVSIKQTDRKVLDVSTNFWSLLICLKNATVSLSRCSRSWIPPGQHHI